MILKQIIAFAPLDGDILVSDSDSLADAGALTESFKRHSECKCIDIYV